MRRLMKRLLLQKIGTAEENTVGARHAAEFKQLKGFSCLIPIPLPDVPRNHCNGRLKCVLE